METEHQENDLNTPDLFGDHYESFEGARRLHEMMEHFETFKDLTRHVGYGIAREAFQRKPCARTLRYIGQKDCQESDSSNASGFFVKGCAYQSIDFNGATYTISGYQDGKRKIGSANFEWVLGRHCQDR